MSPGAGDMGPGFSHNKDLPAHHLVQQEVGSSARVVPVARECGGAIGGGVHRLQQRAAEPEAVQVHVDGLPAQSAGGIHVASVKRLA